MSEAPRLITTEDGSHSLFVPQLNETYHSFHGAIQESRHVFIVKGLNDFSVTSDKQPIEILEVGFGTGLNALLTAEWAYESQRKVHLSTLEAYPVPPNLVKQLNYPQLINKVEASTWFQDIHCSPWGTREGIHEWFSLTKIRNKLEDFNAPPESYDVVFFDAFAPNKQAELWEYDMLSKIYHSQPKRGYFITYCAKGQLKRDISQLGYHQETLSGPPGKKEMVRGVKL